MKKDTERKNFVLFTFFLIATAILTIISALILSRNAASFIMYTALTVFTLVVLLFCIQRKNALFFSLVSVMAALSVVGRIFSPIAAFKPCTAVIIICGSALGADAGFICGVLTALVSNIYFGQGSWTFFQMFAWGMIGLFSGFLSKTFEKHKLILYVFGVFSGFFYSVVMDLFSALWMDGDFNIARFTALTASSTVYTVIYAISNVIFLLLLNKKLTNSLKRTVQKFGVTKEIVS